MNEGAIPEGFADVSTVADCFVGRPGDPVPVGPADGAPALQVGKDGPIAYDGSGLRGDVCKTGNLFSHLAVRDGRTLAVADDPLPQPILGFLGASLLGAVVRFVPTDTSTEDSPLDARGILAASERVTAFALPPGGQRIGYGGEPPDPSITYFEKEMWSENPIFPPPTVEPDDDLLAVVDHETGTGATTLTHADLLDAAGEVVAEWGLSADDDVVIRSSFTHPGTVVAGVLAPIVAGSTIVLPGEEAGDLGTVAVGTGEVPEEGRIEPDAVAL